MSTTLDPVLPRELRSATSLKPHEISEAEARRRLAPCQPSGAISQSIDHGDECRAIGDFENAWTWYATALRQWLRFQYMAVTRRTDCEWMDEHVLADKLRSSLALDPWSYHVLKLVLRRPTPANWLNVDLAAGVVKSLFNVDR